MNETSALVKFYAQNGQEDGFCGHGLISIIKHLKENNFGSITTLILASEVRVSAKVLENGMSSLEIPVSGFQVSSYKDPQFAEFFELSKQEIVEIFKTSPLGDIAIEVSSPESLKNIMLDAKKVDIFSRENNIRIMIFFCKGSSFDFADVEIRVFCSKLYDLEDIVCGSANISVSSVLLHKYNISKYKVVQPFNFKKDGKIGGYQEIEYNCNARILTLNGFAKATKERFIFERLDISFDENLNPVSKNADYHFLKSILTDINVMRTSTFFGCNLPETEKELHFVMKFLLSTDINYGTRKVFHNEKNEYIGIVSLLKAENYIEYGILLKPQFTGNGFGNEVLSKLLKQVDEMNIICSILETNYPSIRIAEKNGMTFDSQITKIYKGKAIKINIYKKLNSQTLELDSRITDLLATQKIT